MTLSHAKTLSVTAPCQDYSGANAFKQGLNGDNGFTHICCADVVDFFRAENPNLMVLTENVMIQNTQATLRSYERLYSLPTFLLSSPGPFCRKRRFGTTIGIRDGEDWGGNIEEVTIQNVLDAMYPPDEAGKKKFIAKQGWKFLPTLMRSKRNKTDQKIIRDEALKTWRGITIEESLVGFGFPVSFFDGPFFDSRGGTVEVSEGDKWAFLGNSVDVKILKVLYRGLAELNFEMNAEEEGQEITTTTTTQPPTPVAAAATTANLSSISDETLEREYLKRKRQ